VAALQGGALIVHFINRKNAPFLFPPEPGHDPWAISGWSVQPSEAKQLQLAILGRSTTQRQRVQVMVKRE